MDWHYIENSERKGPVPAETMSKLLAEGTINGNTQVWNSQLPDWQPLSASSLASSVACNAQPPAVPGALVSNSWVWLLAGCPLIGAIAAVLLSPLTGPDGVLWLMPLLNVLVSYTDERRLAKAGYPTEKWGGAWFIPLYLWRRATYLKQSRGYFWVWCGCFVLALFFF